MKKNSKIHSNIRGKSLTVLIMALVMVGVMISMPSLKSRAAKGDLVTVASEEQRKDPTLILTMGKAEVIELPGMVSDVLVADPSIVDVAALRANHLYAVGLSLGDTNLIALDTDGNIIKRMNIHVRIDESVIQDVVDEMFPDESVRIQALTDQVVLSGRVSTPGVANKITNVVGHYIGEIQGGSGSIDEMIVNLLEVEGEQQVMLRVRVMEVSRNILKELGVDTEFDDIGGLLGSNITGAFERGGSGGLDQLPFGTTTLISSKGAFGPVNLVIDALEDAGYANILAEPNLTTISGEEAGFLAGGEFPVPSGVDQNGNVVVSFRSFGVSLNFRPAVMSPERIMLQLNTEVSSLNRTEAVTIAGLEVPGLDIRRAETTVEMGSGTSLMIAGLLQSDTVDGLAGLPGVMNAPVLGQLMRSENFRRKETELVIIVTPYIVKPYAEKQYSEVVPKVEGFPLAQAFADNIRRIFGKRADKAFEMVGLDNPYGYLLD